MSVCGCVCVFGGGGGQCGSVVWYILSSNQHAVYTGYLKRVRVCPVW